MSEKPLLPDYSAVGIDDSLISADSPLNNPAILNSGLMNQAASDSTGAGTRFMNSVHNIVFSVTDADTVAWAAGTIYLKDGSSYAIGAGNTGNMAAESFIYFDLDVSKVALQITTTKANSEGERKLLLAIAQNSTTEAHFSVFNSKEQNIPGGSIEPGSITLTELGEKSILGWQHTMIFSSSDYRTVAWTLGVITLSDGTTYNITAGNTGNMAALNYIYLDIAISTTVLQVTTTAASAVGTGRILIGVAQNNTDITSKAVFQIFGGSGGTLLTVDNIAANSASVNEFVSNTAQIKDAIITNAKIFALAVEKLIAGTITSKAILMAIAAGTGDSYIAGGNNLDFANWYGGDGSGGAVMLGLDDSDSDKGKFFAGNYSTNEYVWFNGTDLIVNGSPIANQDIFGDGSDGDKTYSADETLDRDYYYDNVTVNAGKIVTTAGYRLFIKGTLTNNGIIRWIGNDGAAGTNASGNIAGTGGAGGAALAAQTLPGGIAGAAGGDGTNGIGSGGLDGGDGSNQSTCLGSNGVAGGDGGRVLTTGYGGTGGTATVSKQGAKIYNFIILAREFLAAGITLFTVAAGSGGGGGGGTTQAPNFAGGGGGGGGGTGGYVVIAAKIIVNSATGTISVNGGNGGNGGNGVLADGFGGGGGGGGNGGVLALIYSSLTNAGSITYAGGSGGIAGTGNVDPAKQPQAGTAGNAGKLIQLQL